jgi:hypothetical protein
LLDVVVVLDVLRTSAVFFNGGDDVLEPLRAPEIPVIGLLLALRVLEGGIMLLTPSGCCTA